MNKRTERGSAAVEFAFVFVLLVTMLFALVEGGIIFMHQASLSAAAREGARMMAITNDSAEAMAAAQDAYPFGSLAFASGPTSCPEPLDRSATTEMTVTAVPSFSLGIFGSPTLTGVGAMRCGG